MASPGRPAGRASHERGAVPRAFTLIELMVVIALVLGIGAVVLPLTLADAGRAALRESQDQLEGVLLSARADAQRTARAVRVMAVESTESSGARWILVTEEVPARRQDDGAAPVRVLAERTLPAGVRFTRSREEAAGVPRDPALDSFVEDEEEATPVEEGAAEPLQRFQVAIFLPDGQISPTRPLYLGGKDGRVVLLQVNTWSGAVTGEVLPPLSADEADGPAEEPGGGPERSSGDEPAGPVERERGTEKR